MDANLQPWLWLGGGLVLLASEFVAPSLVVGFLGAGALTVAGLQGLGLLDGVGASMAVWAVSSGVYVALLRRQFSRWFGEGETSRQSTSDDLHAFGAIVEVVEEVGDDVPGRIRYQGTTWKAHTLKGTVRVGEKVKLLHRDNIGWVVEPVGATALPVGDAQPEALVDEQQAVVAARVKEKA